MPKNPTSALPAVLPVPSPLDRLLRAEGFEAELVIRRVDGSHMTAADRKRAAQVVEESADFDPDTNKIAGEVQAEIGARAALARTKRPAPAASRKARAPLSKRAAVR